jgi:ADP-heptose:LPS heptosyltransferase
VKHREPQKILLVQTAFIGDVILATSLLESIRDCWPNAAIDFLLRKGNESLLVNNPLVNKLIVWDKTKNKLKNLLSLSFEIRSQKYDLVINLQRFFSTGLLTAFSGAGQTLGFRKNPLSFLFTYSAEHQFADGVHEIDRNLKLLNFLHPKPLRKKPVIYLSAKDLASVGHLKSESYICIAPTSVWFTKQYPSERWSEFLNLIPEKFIVYLLGSASDFNECQEIIERSKHPGLHNMSGKLSLTESAALMKDAKMNFVNDSAPMHLCSAVNAPVTAIFCSTVPRFGFGPLSDKSQIIEIEEELACRPCGIHGFKTCPEKHFRCGFGISPLTLLKPLKESK